MDALSIPLADFVGSGYDPTLDRKRLSTQHQRVKVLVLDGEWRTLRQIAEATKQPESSVSAQLRHLRKPAFGGFLVERRRAGERTSGLWEYRVREREG